MEKEKKEAKAATIGARMMPHSLEAEQSVLGSLLIDNSVTHKIFGSLVADDFYGVSHKKIFTAASKIFSNGTEIDYVTLTAELEKNNIINEVGGIGYITTLTNVVPSSANVGNYIKIVTRYSTLRKLILASNQILERSYENDDEENVLRFAEHSIFEIGKEQQKSDLTILSQTMPEVLSHFDLISKDPNATRGVKTGFKLLDHVTNGLQKGDLIVLAARPSVGKTAFALNVAVNAATKHKTKCAVFSLEMSKQQLGQRAVCSLASVSLERALKGKMSATEWQYIWAANKTLCEADIYVDDKSFTTTAEIKAKCQRIAREKGGLDLIIIDYIQLISSPNSSQKENRTTQVSEISRNLKIMAKDLNVPVIALSQLSREVVSGGKSREPVLSDLRESGAIEQDADIVMFLHRPSEDDRSDIKLLIKKHRNGELANINLNFVAELTTFRDATKDGIAMPVKNEMATVAKKNEAKVPSKIVPIADAGADDIFK
ncbi:MAG: replicative DNA helicase [Firmicutes bacterium]|nr:replicative DNA helicase [Bacillota bacterium]